jgi:transposase, IS30 family
VGSGRGWRKPAQYAAYVDLVSRGVGFVEAAERVGVGRSTGWRWRQPEVPPLPLWAGSSGSEREHRVAGVVRAGWSARVERVAALEDVVAEAAALGGLAERGRYLRVAEREIIALGRMAGLGVRAIARLLGRAPSTVSRELVRNTYERTGPSGAVQPSSRRYGPWRAERLARERRRRPKLRKLACDPVLWAHVQECLGKKWSPRQIAKTLPRVFPDQPERHIVHETIYQALYVQGRGELRRQIAAALRSGRARRRPRRDPQARPSRFVEPMVMISERPGEADDRQVPGHWEGDLIIGAGGRSAIATLVERHTRYVLLARLPGGRDAVAVRDALVKTVQTLPEHLWRSLTWDQGSEMARHHEFSIATGIPIYFCDPGSPWLRGSNENTNGLLRQYFPKGSDLSVHDDERLAAVAAELNGRPRETLGWDSPAEQLATLLRVS